MANDPLAGYSPTTDPLAGYSPSSSGGPQQSWSDYMLGHLHSFSLGLNSATRVATDAPTFGLMDKLFGSQAQADTAQAYKDVGNAALPLSLAGSMVTGQGELAGAKAIGETAAPYVGKWLGGVLGSGAVGAGTSALGAYGHEAGWTPDAGDIEKQSLIGGGIGALAAVPGGVVGRAGPVRPPPQIGPAMPVGPMPTLSAADLLAKAKAGYTKAGDVLYDNADIRQAATNAIDEINQQPARVARNGQGALSTLNKIGNDYALGTGAQSGEDLNDFIRSLKMAKTGDDVDLAGRIGQKHMQSVLDNATPITAGGQTPGQVGAGADALNQANQLFGRSQDLERLAVDNPTRAMIQKTQGFYQPGSPEYEAGAAALKSMNPLFNWYAARHVAAPLVGAALGGAYGYMNPAEGENPYLKAIKEAAEDAAIFEGGRKLAQARPQGPINAFRYAIGTGQTQPTAAAPWRDALRMLNFGAGAGGNY